jgi:hypothetical protein
VFYIKRFPRSFQVEFLIRDRFTGGLVLKLFVGHREILARPLFQDLRGHRGKLRFERKAVEQMFETADAGSQDKNKNMTITFENIRLMFFTTSIPF